MTKPPNDLTEWFPPEIKPSRVGVYETATKQEIALNLSAINHWNGKWWGKMADTPKLAEQYGEKITEWQMNFTGVDLNRRMAYEFL